MFGLNSYKMVSWDLKQLGPLFFLGIDDDLNAKELRAFEDEHIVSV
jgi:hypothetical protein